MNWKSRIPEKEKIYQQVIEYLALIEMLLIVPETNVATQRYGAQVIRGEMKNSLLDGDSQNYDLDRGFTRHPIDDNFGQGVVVKLASPYIINCIKLLLWDRDMRYCLFSWIRMRNTHRCRRTREELHCIKWINLFIIRFSSIRIEERVC